jgi:hypothetical protein
MTVSCWLWNNNSPTTAEENLWSVNNGGNVRLRVFRPANQRRLRISVDLSTTDGLWEIGRDIPANQWQHLTVSFDRTAAGNAPSAYLNGAPVPLTVLASPAGTVQTAGNGFRLGADGGSNNRWKGRMDEIRIFNRLVPAEEVPLLLLPNGINRAPDADAGAGREVAVNQTITLAGSATDDGQPAMEGGLTYEWALVSGPAGAQFGSPSSPGSTFTTGTSPGTYALVLFVSDGEATVAQSVELTVPAPPGFLGWLDGYDLPEESSGPNEDPDGDGIPNLLEYALAGGDPETSNANLLPQLSTVEENGEEYLTLTVNKNSAASGLTFHVEACGDLTNWVGGATHVTVISETADQLVVRDNTPISNSNERRFLRLRVSVP